MLPVRLAPSTILVESAAQKENKIKAFFKIKKIFRIDWLLLTTITTITNKQTKKFQHLHVHVHIICKVKYAKQYWPFPADVYQTILCRTFTDVHAVMIHVLSHVWQIELFAFLMFHSMYINCAIEYFVRMCLKWQAPLQCSEVMDLRCTR